MKPLSPKSKRELIRFLKFSVVGIIGAVVDFGTFNILTNVFHVWSIGASVFSFIAAVTSNFIWNRNWTYPDSRSKPILHQAAQFGLVNLGGLIIRTPLFAFAEAPMIQLSSRLLTWPWLSPLIEMTFGTATVMGRNLSLALAVGVVMFWNFGVNRFWTYSDVG